MEQPASIHNPRNSTGHFKHKLRAENHEIGIYRNWHIEIFDLRVSWVKTPALDFLIFVRQQKSGRHERETLLQKLHWDNFQFPAWQ